MLNIVRASSKAKLIICALLASNYANAAIAFSCHAVSGKTVTPLVELYTSEGCSSCPPADRWLSKQVRRTNINANFLAFHVDYWDDIGWPDRFASPLYGQRQSLKVNHAGSSTVYTPQVMIGSQSTVNWRSDAEVVQQLKHANVELALPVIELHATGAESTWQTKARLTLTSKTPDAQWFIAVYQDGLSSQVRAGENKGILLTHDRVVRQWLGPYRAGVGVTEKTIVITLPKMASPDLVGLLLVLESARTGQVYQSLKLPLAHCKTSG